MSGENGEEADRPQNGRDADRPADGAPDDHEELLRLASAAAHQLKAPLSSVQTVLATIMGGFAGPLEPRQRWLLEKAWERCDHGVRLIRDLMNIRNLEQLDEQAFGPVNLLAVVRTVHDAFRDAAAEKELEFPLHVELDDSGRAWVRADQGLVREIVTVLVDNAVKYTPRGGRVELVVRGAGEEDAGRRVVLEVTDTGIGIPEEAREHLFREFYRAPNARHFSSEGTGLGLAFAWRATRRLGGELRVEPSEAGGVRAVLDLPFCSECAALRGDREGALEAAAGPPGGQRPRKISRRVVIIGGVVAGPKAAARIMRLDPDAEVTVVERGKFLAYSGCGLPYYISGAVSGQEALLETPLGVRRDSAFFHQLKNVRTLDLTEAVRIDRERRVVTARNLIDRSEFELAYDELLLATGSRTAVPELPGVELPGIHTLHGVADAEAIRSRLRSRRAREVVLVGGGLLGCEITEAVALRGARITLVEQRASILGIVDPELALLVQRHLEGRGVRVLTGVRVAGFEGGERVERVLLEDGRGLPCDFVLLTTGVRPEVSLAEQAGLEIGSSGAIRVDATMRTSDPHIFAAGDCAEQRHVVTGRPTWVPGAAAATIEGRIAAANICGGDERFPGIAGTLVVKVFDATVARTGLTEARAREEGFDPVSVIVPGPDRAHYIPTARPIVLKLVAERKDGRLLGAQGFGVGEVAKRIDVVATALMAGMDLEGLSHLNLAYAPPYSLVLDNVITAANVLRNKRDGHLVGIPPLELRERLLGGEAPFLLDVRLPEEYGATRLRGSRHIPLGALRSRIGEIPRDRPIVVVCSIGLRSYEASLVLRAHGFNDVRVLDGGLDSWPFEVERLG